MKKHIIFIIFTICLIGCEDNYEHSKFYDFKIKNEFSSSVIKIVPLTESYFWILSSDTIVVMPGDKIIIGTRYEYNNDKKIVDIYDYDDKIESFELYIDNEKSDIDYSVRKYWTFEPGIVDESATYLLVVNESRIKLD